MRESLVHPEDRSSRRRAWAVALSLLGASGALLAAWWWSPGGAAPVAGPVAAPQASPAPGPSAEEVFAARIEPLLREASAEQRAAVDRSVEAFRARFAGFRAGVEPFARDMTSWGTRLGVAARSASGWWGAGMRATGISSEPAPERSALQRYTLAKFERHVLSDQALRDALHDAALALEADLQASRYALWARIEAALTTADGASAPASVRGDAWAARVASRTADEASRQAAGSLAAGVAAVSLSTAASIAAEKAAAALAARLGASAVGAAAGAGAGTASGASAGAAGGAAAGPAGIVVGVGVGIAVAVAVDWWMSDAFRERLEQRVAGYMDELEAALVEGDAETPGLRAALLAAVDEAERAQRQAALARIHEVHP